MSAIGLTGLRIVSFRDSQIVERIDRESRDGGRDLLEAHPLILIRVIQINSNDPFEWEIVTTGQARETPGIGSRTMLRPVKVFLAQPALDYDRGPGELESSRRSPRGG